MGRLWWLPVCFTLYAGTIIIGGIMSRINGLGELRQPLPISWWMFVIVYGVALGWAVF